MSWRAIGVIIALAVAAAGAGSLLHVPGAAAHPLGNFTINHYDRLDVSAGSIHITSVIDYAEIPALQEIRAADRDGDGALSVGERGALGSNIAAALRESMTLIVDGNTLNLEATSYSVREVPGAAGLATLRFEATYVSVGGEWGGGNASVRFENRQHEDRIGWREVVVAPANGASLVGSSVPAIDASHELRAYPDDLLTSPPDIHEATFGYQPAPGFVPEPSAVQERSVRGNPDPSYGRFADLIARQTLSVEVIVLALIAAVGFGAFHALSPGHGKTVVAAYLVGSRGTLRHAALLGLIVTVTHTSSVYALGLVTLYLSGVVLPEDLYPVLTVASGVLIAIMGLILLLSRLRSAVATRRAGRPYPSFGQRVALQDERGALVISGEGSTVGHRRDGDHDHAHDNAMQESHAHGGIPHTHVIPGADGAPVTWRQLLGLGIFGGALPCPSAIIVMLAAISFGRILFGFVLIVAFSIGLAVVLTAIGFAVVVAQRAAGRLPVPGRLATSPLAARAGGAVILLFPIMSAGVVTLAGALIAFRAA